MIRIENTSLATLSVPLQPERGNKSKMLVIPPASAAGPGLVEVPDMDAITLARLRWHYSRRPHDGNAANNAETDTDGNPRYLEIGILKITVGGEKARKPVAEPEEEAEEESGSFPSNSVEPPRKAAPKAPKATAPKAAAKPAPKAAAKAPARKNRVA